MKVKIVGVPEAKSGIHIKPENRGKFTAYKKRTGKTTEEALHSKDPHVRKMAQFAKNARKWKHADGGYIAPEFDYNNDLQVEDDNFTHISPDTIKLTGDYHEDGGTDIMYHGQPVEAERGETMHIDRRDNSAVVGGNLYTNAMGTKMKYKSAFEKLGKQEARNEKIKDKASFLLNNFSPDYKTQAPAFNNGKVMSDAYEQKKAITQAEKDYLTDEQNFQLDMAEHLGQDPKKVNGAMLKADKGKKIRGFTDDEGEMMTIPSDRRVPMSYVWNPDDNQMYPVPDVPNPTPPEPYIPAKPTGTGTVADWFDSRSRPSAEKRSVNKSNVKKQIRQSSASAYNPMNPSFVPKQEHNQPGLPQTFRQQDYINPLPIYEPQSPSIGQMHPQERTDVPRLPAVKNYEDLEPDGTEPKKPIKGLREKFNPLNYLAEITSAFDTAEPVPSTQVRAIMEPEYQVSLQNKKNQILAAYKPAMDSTRRNPAQQAYIAGQIAEQLASVDSEEMLMNQQNMGGIRARNLQELRQVRDTNTQLAADQMNKQMQARGIAAENRYNAIRSISDKEAQRRAKNLDLQMIENYTGWAYDPYTQQYQMNHPGYQGFNWRMVTPNMDEKTQHKEWKYDPRTGKKYAEDKTETLYGGYIAERKPGGIKKKPKGARKGTYC